MQQDHLLTTCIPVCEHVGMKKNTPVSSTEQHILDKRKELVWALAKQGYTMAQLGRLFNISRARVSIIAKEMPTGWQSPWKKYQQQ